MKHKIIFMTIMAFMLSHPVSAQENSTDSMMQANKFISEKKYDLAIKEYQKILKKEPKNQKVNLLIGLCYAQTGDLDLALRHTKTASESDPSSYSAFYNLGLIYAARKESAQALDAIDRSLSINPKSFAAHYQKGLIYSSLEDHPKAIESYQKALELNSQFDHARVALIGAYLKQGDRSNALLEIEQFRKDKKDAFADALEARLKE